jgi:protein-S-isoprenylcysteine O-methyltransferase Ste14
MLGLLYSVASYLGFLAVYCYFAAFSDGVFVPKTVDTGHAHGALLALAGNVGLLLLFGLQHSVMARAGFKRVLTRVVPAALERATFVAVSSVALAAVMWLWQPMSGVVWHVDSPALATALWVVGAIGWLGVPLCSFMIDHFDLFGLRQAFRAFRKASVERSGFVTPLLYRYVRHPMMSAFFLAFWATPHMTIGHLLLSAGMSLYILVGVHFEERSLLYELGHSYEKYQAATPRFVPGRPSPQHRQDTAPASQ